jgi:hypothetical protein
VSFFDPEAVRWLAAAAIPGRDILITEPIRPDVPEQGASSTANPADRWLRSAEVSVETTACGRYEADQLGVGERTTLMVTVSVETAILAGREQPVEVTRLGYVGDRVQLRFRGEPVRDARPAAWDFAG